MSTRKLNRVLEIDVENCTVTGRGRRLRRRARAGAERAANDAGALPAVARISTVGAGSRAARSAPSPAAMAASSNRCWRWRDRLADGSLLETPLAPRAVGGPSLAAMFVGAEGTFGVVTRATLRIYPIAEAHVHDAWVLPSLPAALDVARRLVQHGLAPAMLRIYDDAESGALMARRTHIEGGFGLDPRRLRGRAWGWSLRSTTQLCARCPRRPARAAAAPRSPLHGSTPRCNAAAFPHADPRAGLHRRRHRCIVPSTSR